MTLSFELDEVEETALESEKKQEIQEAQGNYIYS